jgi:hypothetical protein
MARRNSPLVIFGNPKDKQLMNLSESEMWNHVRRFVNDLYTAAMNGDRRTADLYREKLDTLATAMRAQVQRGVHTNPDPVRRRVKIGRHVQAIAYIHEKDGGAYVHGFGNCDPDERDLKRGILNLKELKTVTDVAMYGNPDGTVTLVGTKGQPLAALFD